jgi:hypothetical protein
VRSRWCIIWPLRRAARVRWAHQLADLEELVVRHGTSHEIIKGAVRLHTLFSVPPPSMVKPTRAVALEYDLERHAGAAHSCSYDVSGMEARYSARVRAPSVGSHFHIGRGSYSTRRCFHQAEQCALCLPLGESLCQCSLNSNSIA